MAHFKKTNKERDGHDIDESMREGAREREIDSQRDRERGRMTSGVKFVGIKTFIRRLVSGQNKKLTSKNLFLECPIENRWKKIVGRLSRSWTSAISKYSYSNRM